MSMSAARQRNLDIKSDIAMSNHLDQQSGLNGAMANANMYGKKALSADMGSRKPWQKGKALEDYIMKKLRDRDNEEFYKNWGGTFGRKSGRGSQDQVDPMGIINDVMGTAKTVGAMLPGGLLGTLGGGMGDIVKGARDVAGSVNRARDSFGKVKGYTGPTDIDMPSISADMKKKKDPMRTIVNSGGIVDYW